MSDYTSAPWVDPNLNWKPLKIPAMPERILLDLATKCNLRCPMCTVWGSDDASINSVKGVMDLENSRRILDEIMDAKPLVQPNLWGEPLLAPHLRDQVIAMKQRGIAIAMNTNGLALTDKLAHFFVDHKVDSISFSIDATTKKTLKKIRGIDKLEKIENAVHKLLKIRANAEYPRIGVSFTTQDENSHEKDLFVSRWANVVDVVRIGAVTINGTFRNVTTPKDRTPCPALYNTLPIHHDGTATICCLDAFKTTDLGNVFQKGVKAIWQGEEFAKIRYFHETKQWDEVPFCKNCNGWAQHKFSEKIENGLLIRQSPQYTYYNRIARLKNWQGNLLAGHKNPHDQS